MPLKIVETQRLYRQIADQLRSAILAGEWQVGARLPAERDLAKQMGVSRPSVREALIALEVEGWVEVRTGSGVYVQSPSLRRNAKAISGPGPGDWGPLELIRARRVVEGEVAALAARRAKAPMMNRMAAALVGMQADADAGLAPLEGDREFHAAIAEACQNSVLRDTVHGYWDARHGPLAERLGEHFETNRSWHNAIAEHQKILQAIRARDADKARLAMQRHLDRAHARFSAAWDGSN